MTVQAKDVLGSLLDKMYNVLTADSNHAEYNNNAAFISWMPSGIPFGDELSFLPKGILGFAQGTSGEELSRNIANASAFASIVNKVPDTTRILCPDGTQILYGSSGTDLSDLYGDVLRFSDVTQESLSDADKAKLEKFRNLLSVRRKVTNPITDVVTEVVEDGEIVKLYNDYRDRYYKALTDYNMLRLSSDANSVRQFAFNGRALESGVNEAYNRWVSSGYKNDYEEMNAFITQITQRSLVLWKEAIQNNFNLSEVLDAASGSKFHYTAIYPYAFLTDDKVWSNFSFKTSDEKKTNNSSEFNNSTSLSFTYGIFGGGLDAEYSKSNVDSSLDLEGLEVSFKIVQVPILRPWFSPQFLLSKGWKFNGTSSFKDGLSDGSKPAKGPLPGYTTTAIFVRDVVVKSSALAKRFSENKEAFGLKAQFSMGPFSLEQKNKYGSSSVSSSISEDRSTLTVSGIQLIGFSGIWLPKLPNPADPALFV